LLRSWPRFTGCRKWGVANRGRELVSVIDLQVEELVVPRDFGLGVDVQEGIQEWLILYTASLVLRELQYGGFDIIYTCK